MKTEEVVVLARYSTADEAQVISTMLYSMGIQNEIMNETAAQVMPYLSSDVSIMVNSSDYEKARALLDANFYRDDLIIKEKRA